MDFEITSKQQDNDSKLTYSNFANSDSRKIELLERRMIKGENTIIQSLGINNFEIKNSPIISDKKENEIERKEQNNENIEQVNIFKIFFKIKYF